MGASLQPLSAKQYLYLSLVALSDFMLQSRTEFYQVAPKNTWPKTGLQKVYPVTLWNICFPGQGGVVVSTVV